MARPCAIVYFDSRNFYHGLKTLGVDGCAFDYMTFAKQITENKTLEAVKFYCAIYPRWADETKHHRDIAFYKALSGMGITVITGRFNEQQVNGLKIPKEKGVDVKLATDLILDAMHMKYDHAYVISSDTDLIPAIEAVNKSFGDKKIFNFAFAKMASFTKACDASMKIFPDRMKSLEKPELYPAAQKILKRLSDEINSKRMN